MFGFNFISVELGSLIEISSGIFSERKKLDRDNKRKLQDLVACIRELYADDQEIRALRAFVNGAPIPSIQLASYLLQAEVSRKRIDEALDEATDLAIKTNLLIPLDAIARIKELSDSKIGLRFGLSEFIASIWDAIKSSDDDLMQMARKQGEIILGMIDLLNEQLVYLDRVLGEKA